MKDALNLGGKANVLMELKSAGFPVPNFVVFAHDQAQNVTEASVQVELQNLEGDYFAVRSSANVEDGNEHSFAGIFDTELYIQRDHVPSSLRRVHEALKSEALQAYCSSKKLEVSSIKLHIIVQEMIPAQVSGVAFSLDPNKPYRKSPLINAVYGLGEGLVSGHLNADVYLKQSGLWKSSRPGHKQKLVYQLGEVSYVGLTAEEEKKPTLTTAQCEEVEQILLKLEHLHKCPQDIEFCYAEGRFFLLQSRPITAVREISEHVIWDNSNIVESYPGITLPFTFSFILPIYESVYRNFGELLGVPKSLMDSNKEVFEQMLGHINGRVYYHLIHWYKALAMLPAYQLNAQYMEKMMGVSEPLGIPVELKDTPPRWKNYFYLGRTALRILRLNRKLPSLKKDFQKKVHAIVKSFKEKEYKDQDAKVIWKDYMRFKSVLVNEWKPPLANDLLAMVYFGTLQKLCENWLGDSALHTRLIVGKHDVISVKPAEHIQMILKAAEKEGRLDTIRQEETKEVWKACQRNQFGKTGALILEYIDLYGDRSVGELKLENPTYATHPEMLIDILKSYKSTNSSKGKDNDENTNIELSGWKRIVFRYVERKAAEMVTDRENLRFDRTLGFGVVRRFLHILGNRFTEQGLIDSPADIHYLAEKEVGAWIQGHLSRTEIQKRIAEQKEIFNGFEKIQNMPERIHEVDGHLDLEIYQSEASDQLVGIPCCAGVVKGRVQVLRKPSDVKSLNGDILVTQSTDPGWITIFQSASAILVERGSTLSHAAIVSREMGIPCIVGIKGITNTLKTGDVVEMNGSTGEIIQHGQ
jgi:phosphoenolpyruvate synthase/pyruvate phosphate dikinase